MSQTIGAVFELRDNFTGKAQQVSNATRELQRDIEGSVNSINKIQGATSQASNSLNKLNSNTSSTSRSNNNMSSNIKKVSGATKTLEGNINGAASSIKDFGNGGNIASRGIDSLKSKIIGLAGTYLSLKGAKKLADSAIGEASGLEQYRNTLNVVMKDSKKAKETMSWAVGFANKTPFETNEVVEGAVKLQSYGLTAKNVMTDIGNMSSVMGKSLDQGVEAIADAQTGELERMKEFGITKQMIVDQGSKIMKGKELVNSKGQIVDQANFNKAMFSLMQERYKGGMDLQSKTLKGTMSTVTGVAKNALAQLMGVTGDGTIKVGGLFDKVKGKATSMANTLQKWSNDGTITRATKKIEDGFNAAGKAIGWVKDNSNWLIPVTVGLVSALGALSVINTVKGMMDAWKGTTFAQTWAQKGLNVALKDNPIGVVITLIGLAVVAGVALYMHWDTVKAKAKELWSSITKTFTNIKNDVIEKWNAIKEFLSHPIKGAINIAKKITGDGEAKSNVDGSHANGLGRVPFDNYKANLHKDEMVLTKNQAENYRKGESKSNSITKQAPIVNININGTNKSTKEIVNELIPQLKLELNNM